MSVIGIACFSIAIFFLKSDFFTKISYAKAAAFVHPQMKVADIVESIPKVLPSEQGNPGIPIRLKIPSINLDTALEQVGLTQDGAVGVPKDPAKAAWYQLGPRPGGNGNAIITGHYGRWKNGEGSVFDALKNVKVGDQITVVDDKEKTISFIVRELRTLNSDADASDVFGATDGMSHLNLITCEGVWNKQLKSFPYRLVIFADKGEK